MRPLGNRRVKISPMQSETESCPVAMPDLESRLDAAISHAAHLLPAQGPINVFVHHNTLHAFEEQGFHEAVAEATETFGCHPYLLEDEYREELAAERMQFADVEAALKELTSEGDKSLAGGLTTRLELRRLMLRYPLYVAPAGELKWLVAESDALRKIRPEVDESNRIQWLRSTHRWILRDFGDGLNAGKRETGSKLVESELTGLRRGDPASWPESDWEAVSLQLLWAISGQATKHYRPHREEPELIRHRELLYRATGMDSDRPVNELLTRFCAAYLDQGFSQWQLPGRERGLFHSFVELYSRPGLAPSEQFKELSSELGRLKAHGTNSTQSILESLRNLGVDEANWDEYLSETFLALRGWAGMIHQVERRGDRVPLGVASGSLRDFLAIRLLLDRLVLKQLCQSKLSTGYSLGELRKATEPKIARLKSGDQSELARAFALFQLAQLGGWFPEKLCGLSEGSWSELQSEIESFSTIQRRKIFQLAFESGYRRQVLNAYGLHTRQIGLRQVQQQAEGPRPSFQIVCCIDDREESFRRHLEELDPNCQTFGSAGFFAVPMYYRGAADAHFVPLCPIILQPQHYVVEEVRSEASESHDRRARARRVLGKQAHALHTGSRSFLGGWGMAVFGPLATLPLVARVLFPRATAGLRRTAGRMLTPPVETELTLERAGGPPGKEPGQLGFTVPEMADSVERLLRDIGLIRNFSQIVIVCGHGSASLNNPHESAYNCGACGGGRGGPNARAVCAMANDPRVRALLRERGLNLPDDTWFVGAFHNTCDDSVRYSDTERIPLAVQDVFAGVRQLIDRARPLNAHERCRRFVSAELSMSPAAALRHVETRAEDLSQTRPEYNHATNAVCTVARRARTRGLFLDRRSFLVSYDPTQDTAEQAILARTLGAVIPVCGGINLEYYFSRVDVAGYGCGSKLPHNVTSLLGVMDGAASDLRTGLSAQMVEIHDPVRLLFVIETRPEHFLSIMQRNPVIRRLCGNGWVQVATLSPDSDEIHLLEGEHFVRYTGELTDLPRVGHSVEWYRGWRGNLGFAQVTGGLMPGVSFS